MRLIDIIMNVALAASKDPSIILSWARLLQTIKNGTSDTNNPRKSIGDEPGMDAPGAPSEKDDDKV